MAAAAAAATTKRVQIPTDLTTDILWRLPANACNFRFRCVSKSWRDFLSNPSYISQQLSGCADDSSSSSSDHKTMIKSGSFLSMSSVSIMHPDNTFEPLLPENHRDSGLYLEVEAYCNGLFCLSRKSVYRLENEKDLILWNPATSEIKLVPRPPNVHHKPTGVPWSGLNSQIDAIMGQAQIRNRNGPWLGYDPDSDDYKILCQARTVTQTGQTDYFVEVYSLRNDSWRKLDNDNDGGYHPVLPSPSQRPSAPQFRKGKLYWLQPKLKKAGALVFDSFDMASEVFQRVELSLPASLYSSPDVPKCLLKEESMVALFQVRRDPRNPGMSIREAGMKRGACNWEIWALLKCWVPESWTKLYVVTTRPASFMGFSRNLNCFFVPLLTHQGVTWEDVSRCVVFHPRTREFSYPCITGEEIINYVPSRIPLRSYSDNKGMIKRKKRKGIDV